MTEREIFQFYCRPAAQSAANHGDDSTHEANRKTLGLFALSEFSVGTGVFVRVRTESRLRSISLSGQEQSKFGIETIDKRMRARLLTLKVQSLDCLGMLAARSGLTQGEKIP